jgi:hypothetical protein
LLPAGRLLSNQCLRDNANGLSDCCRELRVGALSNQCRRRAISLPRVPQPPPNVDGATTIAGGDGSRLPTANELQGARYQGRKIAGTANKLHG